MGYNIEMLSRTKKQNVSTDVFVRTAYGESTLTVETGDVVVSVEMTAKEAVKAGVAMVASALGEGGYGGITQDDVTKLLLPALRDRGINVRLMTETEIMEDARIRREKQAKIENRRIRKEQEALKKKPVTKKAKSKKKVADEEPGNGLKPLDVDDDYSY